MTTAPHIARSTVFAPVTRADCPTRAGFNTLRSGGAGEALLAAFNSLLPTAAPDRRAAVLRNAEPRIRGELELRGISMGVLAQESGLPRSTLEKVLSPKGAAPGRLIAEKLAAWLDASVNRPRAAPPTPAPANMTG